jgi:zinc transport system substrate-binding protein
MAKIIITIIVSFFIAFPVDAVTNIGKVNVVTSFYPMYIMAINVCKDVPGVTVTNLTPATTGCLHDYSVTTNDMKKLAGANVFVANGAGMESFLNKIVEKYPTVDIATLSDGIPLIKANGNEGDNPHLWVSISNAILQVKNLGLAMEAFDLQHKELYRKNTDAYVAKLEALRERMHSQLDQFKGRKIITFHEAFPYFTKEFGLEIAAVVEREPGSQPSAKELANTIDLVKKSGIKALFSEPQYPDSAISTIAKETGSTVYMLDPAVTGPDSPDAYINIMEQNLVVLKKALEKT